MKTITMREPQNSLKDKNGYITEDRTRQFENSYRFQYSTLNNWQTRQKITRQWLDSDDTEYLNNIINQSKWCNI